MNTVHIRRKLKGIVGLKQITKAMELVSAAKMRKAQVAALQSREYSRHAKEILALIRKTPTQKTHFLMRKRAVKKELFIVITSDRGLAGAYNTQILKKSLAYIAENKTDADIVVAGKKGEIFLGRRKLNLTANFSNLPTNLRIQDIYPIIKIAAEGFKTKQYDKVSVGYMRFDSTVKQTPVIETILPTESGEILEEKEIINKEYQFEPDENEVLEYIIPRLMETRFYQTVLEAIASEHSARMVAMKNATDNASEIIGDLQLTYNSVRQAGITKELLEIISGAEAIS